MQTSSVYLQLVSSQIFPCFQIKMFPKVRMYVTMLHTNSSITEYSYAYYMHVYIIILYIGDSLGVACYERSHNLNLFCIFYNW